MVKNSIVSGTLNKGLACSLFLPLAVGVSVHRAVRSKEPPCPSRPCYTVDRAPPPGPRVPAVRGRAFLLFALQAAHPPVPPEPKAPAASARARVPSRMDFQPKILTLLKNEDYGEGTPGTRRVLNHFLNGIPGQPDGQQADEVLQQEAAWHNRYPILMVTVPAPPGAKTTPPGEKTAPTGAKAAGKKTPARKKKKKGAGPEPDAPAPVPSDPPEDPPAVDADFYVRPAVITAEMVLERSALRATHVAANATAAANYFKIYNVMYSYLYSCNRGASSAAQRRLTIQTQVKNN